MVENNETPVSELAENELPAADEAAPKKRTRAKKAAPAAEPDSVVEADPVVEPVETTSTRTSAVSSMYRARSAGACVKNT